MKTAAISQLKAKLSEYIRVVQAGEEVLVVNHGKPVAKLIPIKQTKDMTHEEWVEHLFRTGQARRGTGKLPDDFWDRPRPNDPEGIAVKLLIQEREEGW